MTSRKPPLVLLALLPLFLCTSCGDETSSAANDVPVPYLCQESKQLVMAAPGPTPAVHPATGKATLVRALYCADCSKWVPVPPSDVYRGNPQSYPCPRHKTAMSSTGPGLPDGS